MHNHHMAQLENFRLKVFRAVAEHLNFRKAAEQLFLTQPAVTLHTFRHVGRRPREAAFQ